MAGGRELRGSVEVSEVRCNVREHDELNDSGDGSDLTVTSCVVSSCLLRLWLNSCDTPFISKQTHCLHCNQ